MPSAQIKFLDGAGHACQLEQPWLFDQHLIDFLRARNLFPDALSPRSV